MTVEKPSTAVAPVRREPIHGLAERFEIDPEMAYKTLIATVWPTGYEAVPAQVRAFAMVCNEYGLNPWVKQIYAFPNRGGGVTPVVGIDGWLHVINGHPQMDGMDVDVQWAVQDGARLPVSATCRIYRKDRAHPVTITEFYAECSRPTDPWRQMPARMLRHKAIIQCGRVAFGIAGLYDEDEARDIAGGPREPEYVVANGRGVDLDALMDGPAETRVEQPSAAEADEPAPVLEPIPSAAERQLKASVAAKTAEKAKPAKAVKAEEPAERLFGENDEDNPFRS